MKCDICSKEIKLTESTRYGDVSPNPSDEYHNEDIYLSDELFHISYSVGDKINTHGHCCKICYDELYPLYNIDDIKK